VTPLYDPMVAKLIVADTTREAATARMLRALDEYEIGGLTTLIPFHKALLRSEQWQRGETCRDLLEDPKWLKSLAPEEPPAAGEDDEEKLERDYTVEVNNRRFSVKVIGSPPVGGTVAASANSAGLARAPRRDRSAGGASADGASESLTSPLQGTVLRVAVKKGEEVESGAVVCVIEAMKMENEITAHRSGKVEELNVAEGASVATGETIAVIK
jgi:acetyl-CoA/propionyl-CoA carboxylase biotin carboxyl carrier protein